MKRRYVCYTAFLRRAEGVKQKARLFLNDYWKEYFEQWLMIPNPPLWRKKMALFNIQNAKGLILLDSDGDPFEITDDEITLCRCGQSRNKPFCDDSHIRTGFKSEVKAPTKP